MDDLLLLTKDKAYRIIQSIDDEYKLLSAEFEWECSVYTIIRLSDLKIFKNETLITEGANDWGEYVIFELIK